MKEVDEAVSRALRNGIQAAPIAELTTFRPLDAVIEYLREDWHQVKLRNNLTGIVVFESPNRVAFELKYKQVAEG